MRPYKRHSRKKLDPWDNSRFTMRFPAYVEVLYMTREEIERQHKAGEVSDSDYKKYWKGVNAKHLEEIAVHLDSEHWGALQSWIKTWRHEGGGYYMTGGYAVRCGGANQHKDPVNIFFLKG